MALPGGPRRPVSGRHREAGGSLRPGTRGRPPWSDHASLTEGGLLGDDPAAIVGALVTAARAGASPADLGRSIAYAASLRVARFSNANEHADWETAHHAFTHANAVHQLLKRTGAGTDQDGRSGRGRGPRRPARGDGDLSRPLPQRAARTAARRARGSTTE